MFGAGYLLQMLRDAESGSQGTKSTNSPELPQKRMNENDVSSVHTVPNSDGQIIPFDNSESPRISSNDDPSSKQHCEDFSAIEPIEEICSTAIQGSSNVSAEKNLPNEAAEEDITTERKEEETKPSEADARMTYCFSTPATMLLQETSAFSSVEFNGNLNYNNFLKGCKWSPDGSCLLTNSEDRTLRVFTLPLGFYEQQFSKDGLKNSESLNLLSAMGAGELVYDYCWYPLMNSSVPETCVYVQTARDHPIQLCDALSGNVCATYLPINHLDEVSCAHSLTFSRDGGRLYAGFNKTVRIFDTYRPGRQLSTKNTWRKRHGGQSGIISCIAVCPTMPSLYACGSYGRTIATYSEDFDNGPLSLVQVEDTGGMTHMQYHPNGNYLYSGGRMDEKIICWDMRVPGRIFAHYQREAETNQRFYFDLDWCGQHLVSGSSNGQIKVWNTASSPSDNGLVQPALSFQAHRSASNGASFNPYLPLLATASGQRRFPCPLDKGDISSSDTDDDEPPYVDDNCQVDNSVKLWFIGQSASDR